MTADPSSSKRRDSTRQVENASGRRSLAQERPTHPRKAAAILMVAIVVLLLVISVVPLL